MEPVEISAGRLHLRPPTAIDEQALVAACQDAEIQRWTRVPFPYTQVEARTFVTQTAPICWRDDVEYCFVVCDAASGDLLASAGLRPRRKDRNGEIGYWTAPWAREQGVASAAVAAVCRWGFDALGLARIEWHAAVGNDGSRRVAEKVGFQLEGTQRSALELNGVRHDAWVGGLLPDEMNDVR